MRRFWIGLALAGLIIVPSPCDSAAEPQPSLDRIRKGKIRNFPKPSENDLALVNHSYRTLLRALDGDRPPWPNVASFLPVPLALRTGEHQYLFGHPAPPEDHFLVSIPVGLGMRVYGIESDERCDVSFARPLFGAPTIVKGSQACTGEGSTDWMFDYIRRAHRIYLYQHSELLKVSRLNVPFPDPEEKWKGAFPFPFDDPEVIAAVRALGNILHTSFWQQDRTKKFEAIERYLPARRRLTELLESRSDQYSANDFFRYYTWAEGIPHFAAYSTFQYVGRSGRTPAPIMDAFPDFTSFSKYAAFDLRIVYQRFARLTDEPLTLEDLTMIGALTSGTVHAILTDWKDLAIERDVWLEDLMSHARLEAR